MNRGSQSAIRRFKAATSRVENQPYDFTGRVRAPRLGGASGHAFCQLSASLGPATGTWPSLTCTSTTADVYVGSGTSMKKIATAAKLYNRRNVTWASGKTTFLVPNGDGSWDVIDQDC